MSFAGIVRTTVVSFAAAAAIASGAGAASAEPMAGNEPKAADVATLRGLLALQYPSLRITGSAPEAAVAAPSVTVEPARAEGQSEGGA